MKSAHIILAAHGSRNKHWRQTVCALTRRVGRKLKTVTVSAAFLSLSRPTLAEAVGKAITAGSRHLVIMPLFIAGGSHARADIARKLRALKREHPHIRIETLQPVGDGDWFADALGKYLGKIEMGRLKKRPTHTVGSW